MSKLDNNSKFYFIMLLLSSVGFLYLSIKVYDNIKAVDWPTVEGTVISSEIVPLKKSTNYIFTIKYEYHVSEKKYINDKFSIINEGISKKQAMDLSNSYQDNSLVMIFYDIDNPQNSFVRVDISYILVLIWSIVMGLMFLSLFKLYYGTLKLEK